MTVGILTEKPSAAKAFAAALGGMNGTYNGERYVIAAARGHLYEFRDPSEQVPAEMKDRYKKWNVEYLPWDESKFDWSLESRGDAASVATTVASKLSSCDELVVACDVDPTGEGGMIATNAFLELGLDKKPGVKFSRMYFTDEAAASLQKAFSARKPIPDIRAFDEYRKARYRSQWDLLSMQFTRVSTAMSRQYGKNLMLRQGRLKSAMVQLVGDQLKAYNDYVKKPFFQNRFRDENKVVYTNPDEPTFDTAAQVPQSYSPSAVVKDSATMKRKAPPKLLDLAGLSTILQSKGIKPEVTLATYQKMYQASSGGQKIAGVDSSSIGGFVSYPRTEDKNITPEQFSEMLPVVDAIAGVVGVDTAKLTHRAARSTHVKPKGAHGANRPGLRVPVSLDALESEFGKAAPLIYQTLAMNFLAMLAEDYEYEQQKGHLADYPAFVGTANVPKSLGWKAVFDPDADDEDAKDENESTTGLGTTAEPFVHEGANKRPEHPSMRWLMKQLEKHDVGTGATRTSTYADVTSTRTKYPLLKETGKRLLLAECGELSWHLLPNTHIGSLQLTEKVYQQMADIADGKATAEELLPQVAQMVREDIATMQANADKMGATLGLTKAAPVERAEGVWQAAPGGPKQVRFKKSFSSHSFTDEEIAQLLAGETIEFAAVSAKGDPFKARGKLAVMEFKGKKYVGFQRAVAERPTQWAGHTFTEGEVATLLAGKPVERTDWVSAKGSEFACEVTWDAKAGKVTPNFDTGRPPAAWCGHTFTPAELKTLESGEPVEAEFTFKSGKKSTCKVWFEDDGSGTKRIVPEFARGGGAKKKPAAKGKRGSAGSRTRRR